MMKRSVIRLMVVVLLLLSASVVLAQSGGSYDLSWWTVDSGGYTFSTGGSYSLGGTIGQPDAGAPSGGSYSLTGGFWGGAMAASAQRHLYLPLAARKH